MPLLRVLPPLCALLCPLLGMLLPIDTTAGFALQALLFSAPPWLMLLWLPWTLLLRAPRRIVALSLLGLLTVGLPRWPAETSGRLVVVTNVNAFTGEEVALEQFLGSLGAEAIITLEQRGASLPGMVRVADDYAEVLPRPSHAAAIYCRDASRCQARVTEQIGSETMRMPVALLRLPLTAGDLCILGVHAPPAYPRDASGMMPYIHHIAAQLDPETGRLQQDWPPCRAHDPVLLAGDLNAVPWSAPYRTLRGQGLRDVRALSGIFGVTWPTGGGWLPFPLLRLDHVLVSQGVPLVGMEARWVPNSDHKGLWLWLP